MLELCSPILPKLSPAPEDGWLSFCYRYIRGAPYPAGDFAPDGEGVRLEPAFISQSSRCWTRSAGHCPLIP